MDGLVVIRAAVKEAYERRRDARLRGDTSTVESARRNVAKGADAAERVFILTSTEADPDDGTRPWME